MRYFALSLLILAGCQTTGSTNVGVGSTYPSGDCKELGQVIGTSTSSKNSHAKATEDIKHEASLRGGNYVRILATSAHGAAVRGIAFDCR